MKVLATQTTRDEEENNERGRGRGWGRVGGCRRRQRKAGLATDKHGRPSRGMHAEFWQLNIGAYIQGARKPRRVAGGIVSVRPLRAQCPCPQAAPPMRGE